MPVMNYPASIIHWVDEECRCAYTSSELARQMPTTNGYKQQDPPKLGGSCDESAPSWARTRDPLINSQML
jgi:hypothetical protein